MDADVGQLVIGVQAGPDGSLNSDASPELRIERYLGSINHRT